jgi:hypothetical protein
VELLTPPYGYHNQEAGVHISLRCAPGTVQDHELIEALENYSCWPPAIPKILSCLKVSGRYDCIVQRCWFRWQREKCVDYFWNVGVRLLIL